MDHFLTALMNELRVQGVTTIYSFEVPDIMGPHIRAPIGDLSSLAENLVLMRYIEQRSRLHRLISILKVRDSDFDPSMHQFILTDQGLVIEETSKSAEAIMAAFLPPLGKCAAASGPEAAAAAWGLAMATVLVVDDEFGIAELFEAILTDVGHRVLTAINGKHGLEVLAEEHADLVFLDYMMPVMTGAAMLAAHGGRSSPAAHPRRPHELNARSDRSQNAVPAILVSCASRSSWPKLSS